MLPRKIFENLHTVMGILAFFEQFVNANFVLLPLISPSPRRPIMQFVRIFSIYACLKVGLH